MDFHVAGKPNPPPVNLTATFWRMVRGSGDDSKSKAAVEFTDATGTLVRQLRQSFWTISRAVSCSNTTSNAPRAVIYLVPMPIVC